jgi:hypothetical protein
MAGVEIKVTDETNLKDFPVVMGENVSDTLFRLTNRIANWIQDQTPEGATSQLRNMTKAEFPVMRGEAFVGMVGNPLNYAPYIIGEGAGPAVGHGRWWPPIEPLVYWVRRKGLAGKYSLKTHRRLGNKQTQGDEDYRIARAIQFVIHMRGLKGHDLFTKAENKFFNEAEHEIKSSIDEVAKEFSD